MVEAARLVARIDADTSGFQRGMEAVNQQIATFGSTVARGAAFALGFDAMTRSVELLGQGIGDLAKNAIDLNASLEQSNIALTTLTKSAGDAKDIISQLRDLSSNSMFNLTDLTQGAQRMAALGVSAQNIVPLMRDVALSVAAVGGSTVQIQRVTYALSQMVSTGTVNAREMRELAMDGVPAWEILTQAMGKSQDEVRGMVQQNQISAKTFVEAYDAYVNHNFGTLLEAQANTFNGAVGIIKNNVKLLVADGFQPLFDEISKIAVSLANFARSNEFQSVIGAMQESVKLLITGIKDLGNALAPLGEGFKKAFETIANGGSLGDAIKKLLDGVKQTVENFSGDMFDGGITLIKSFADGMVSGAGSALNGALNEIAQFIADFFIGHSPPPEGPLGKIDQGGQTLMQTYADGMMTGASAVKDVATKVQQDLEAIGKSMTLEQGQQAVLNAAGNLDAMKDAATEVDFAISALDHRMAGLNITLTQTRLQIQAIKDSFGAQMQPIQDQITQIDHSGPNIDRKRSELDLQSKINAVKLKELNDPNAGGTQYDQSINDLKAKLVGEKNPDSSDLDGQIRDLQKQAEGMQYATRGIDDEIAKAQRDLEKLGRGATDAVDASIQSTKDQLHDLDNGDLQQIQAKIALLRDQLKSLKSDDQRKQIDDLLKRRADASDAEKTVIDAQLAPLREKYKVQKQTDDAFKDSATTQLDSLTVQEQAEKAVNDGKKQQLNDQLYALEKQKKSIEDGIAVQKQGAQDHIKDLETTRTGIERQAQDDRKAIQDKIQGLQEEKRGRDALAQKERTDTQQQITDLEEKKQHAKDIYENEIAQYTNQKAILDLLDQQDSLQKEILKLPLQQQLDDLKSKEDDILKPLLAQEHTLQGQNDQLGLEHQQWELIKRDLADIQRAYDLAHPKTKGGGDEGQPSLPPVPKPDESVKEKFRQAGKEAADKFIEGFKKSIEDHFSEEVGALLGAIIGGAFFGPIGAIIGAAFGVVLTDKIDEQLKAHGTSWGQIAQQISDYINNTVLPALKEFADWFETTGKPALENFASGVKLFFDDEIVPAFDIFKKDILPVILTFIDDVMAAWKGLDTFFHDHGGLMKDIIGEAWKSVADTIRGALEIIGGLIKTFSALFDGDWKGLWNGILETLKGIWDLIKGVIGDRLAEIGGIFENWMGPFKDLSLKMWDGISTYWGNAFSDLGKHTHEFLTGLQDTWDTLAKPFVDSAKETLNGLKDTFVDLFGGIWNDVIEPFFDKLHQALQWVGDNLHIGPLRDSKDPGLSPIPLPGHADGLKQSAAGHWAFVGEQGKELIYVPGGASILSHGDSMHAARANGIPGHFDGFNADDALKKFGVSAGGEFGGLPILSSLLPMVKDALGSMIASAVKSLATGGLNLPGMWHRFSNLDFSAYQQVLGNYGGSPINDEGDFNTLLAVAKEQNIDPRFLMAVMQTESGYGSAAGRIGDFWNFIGMGMNDRGWAFDSGVRATDGGPEYAGYHSFHDMLEDLSAWVIENNGNVSGYQQADQGQGKMSAYAQILAETLGNAGGGGSAGGIATVEGMPGDALLGIAQNDLAGFFGFCEQYVGDVMQAAGLRYARSGSAEEHAHLQPLNPGMGPLGAIEFFPDSSGFGHVAFSMGDGHTVWGTKSSGKDNSQVGFLDVTGWNPYGWTDNPYADGGWINEPVVGIGTRSGQSYSFGEKGPEYVDPSGPTGAGGVTVNLEVHVHGNADAPAIRDMKQAVGDAVLQALAASGHSSH